MTTSARMPAAQAAHERKSAVLVIVLVLVALLLGWWVKTAVQNDTRFVQYDNVTAAVPTGWLLQEGTGDLIFVARNPQALDQLFRVSLVANGSDLEALATDRNFARSQLESTFRVLEATPIVFDGRDGYKVSYALADSDSPGMPIVIEGTDYYFPQGNEVLIISLETTVDTYDDTLPYFQRFVKSITLAPGDES